MNRRIVILTWVSWSGKTTIQEQMLKNWWVRPINFTTRKPRSDNELDEYVFLKRKQFLTKYANWDFLEQTNYWWNFYGVSKYLPKDKNICIILDPVWRATVEEYFSRAWIEVETYYIRIPKEVQEERLYSRGDSDEEVERRKRDYKWFSPTSRCVILDWRKPIENLVEQIEKWIESF